MKETYAPPALGGDTIYTAARISEILRSAGVRQVCMRYGGAEGRGGVSQVNFLTHRGEFLGYGAIQQARLPEAEVYALGEEMLIHCKKDWIEDWGGHGELHWILTDGVRIIHQDRRVENDLIETILAERRFSGVLLAGSLPQSEAASIESLAAEFEIEQGGIAFGRIQIEHDGLSPSQVMVDGTRQVLLAAVQEALKDRPACTGSGLVRWKLRKEFFVTAEVEREAFEEMRFSIPDVSVVAVASRAPQDDM